jgi:hypothetical protein
MNIDELLEELKSDEFGIYLLWVLYYFCCWTISFCICLEVFGMNTLSGVIIAIAVSSVGTFLGGFMLAAAIWFFFKHRKLKKGDIFYDVFHERNEWKLDKSGKMRHKDDKLF